jgi:thioredoxin
MEVYAKNFEHEVLRSKMPVLVEFWASWCPPCKMMDPVLQKLQSEFKNKIKIRKINVDLNPSIATKYDINGVPTFILFKDGKEMVREVGAKTETQLRQLIAILDRIKEPPTGFPKVLLLDTTNACNLRCSMCGHRFMKRKVGIMSMELFRKIIDEIAEVSPTTRVWMVFFGEALIIKNRLFEMIRYAKQKGLKDVVLNTNGTLLDADAARGLIEAGLDAIYIGIDAFTPETYSKLRVGGDYKTVVENVIRLLKIKKELNANNLEVVVQFVEMEENEKEKEEFIKFWTQQGAYVKIRPKVTWAGIVKAHKMKLGQAERYPCHWAMQGMAICWDGKACLCAVDIECKVVVGDVTKQSIKEIWMNGHKRIRELHLRGEWDKLPELCRNCRDWQCARSETWEPQNGK